MITKVAQGRVTTLAVTRAHRVFHVRNEVTGFSPFYVLRHKRGSEEARETFERILRNRDYNPISRKPSISVRMARDLSLFVSFFVTDYRRDSQTRAPSMISPTFRVRGIAKIELTEIRATPEQSATFRSFGSNRVLFAATYYPVRACITIDKI